MRKIWRDFSIKRTIFLSISISAFIFILAVTYKGVVSQNAEAIITLIFVSIFTLGYAANILRTRLTYLTKEGIRLGNAQDDVYEKIKLPHKPTFYRWRDIRYIKIIGRDISTPLAPRLINMLILRPKKGTNKERMSHRTARRFCKSNKKFR